MAATIFLRIGSVSVAIIVVLDDGLDTIEFLLFSVVP